MTQLPENVRTAAELLRGLEIDGQQGLPEELFLLASGLVPLPNVDLLVTDRTGRLLLSRRNDPYFEQCWHIPGGCLRWGEDFAERIHATALRELGCDVHFEETPLAVRNVIRGPNQAQKHPNERGHNVAILFRCQLPEDYQIDNGVKTPEDNGYLQWFRVLPPDFMKIQLVYRDVLGPWLDRREIDGNMEE